MKDDDKLLMGYLRDRGYIFYPSYEKLYVMMSHDLVAGHGMEDIAVCRDVDEKISGLAVQYDSSGWLLEKLTRLMEKKRFYILFWEGGDGKKAMMTYHDLGSYVRVGGYASEGEHVSFSRLVRGVTYFHSRRCHKPMTFALHKKPDMDGIHEGIMFTYTVQSL